MSENQRASVWYIEENNLKHCNKIISKLNYKGLNIAVLKEELNNQYQDFLIKDKNNEYWSLGIAPIKFRNFEQAITQANETAISYCNDISINLNNARFKKFFESKIDNEKWFNKCEIEYICRYYPEIYEQAQKCRNNILEQRNVEKQEAENKKLHEQKEKVETLNNQFRKQLRDLKYKIFIGEDVTIENLEFYKDNKLENGKTTQNSILYLAKHYGIEIPIATQGFINNRLVKYNFRNGNFSFKQTNNKRASVKMHEYMEQIFKMVKEELKNELETKKRKNENVR